MVHTAFLTWVRNVIEISEWSGKTKEIGGHDCPAREVKCLRVPIWKAYDHPNSRDTEHI